MTNSNKTKGDRAERESVRVLADLTPDLVRPDAKRMLGAGRADDIGDLSVYDDVAIQVRARSKTEIGAAVRTAAADAVAQAANGDRPYALGMVPIPQARAGTVRWLACVASGEWPTDLAGATIIEHRSIAKALAWLRDDTGPHGYIAHPRTQRIGLLHGGGHPVLVAPIEAWTTAYRRMQLLQAAPAA